MDTGESMQQMTSFSMVEQMTNMAAENTKIAQSLTTSNAVGLIGRTVTYIDADKVEQTGKVEQRHHRQGRQVVPDRRRQDRHRSHFHHASRLIRRHTN